MIALLLCWASIATAGEDVAETGRRRQIGCDPKNPCVAGISFAGQPCGTMLNAGCPGAWASCACEVDLHCVSGRCQENPGWYVWTAGAGEMTFDAPALERARADRRRFERTLDDTRKAVAKRFGRIDCPECTAIIQPVQDHWRTIIRREQHLIGADAPRLPEFKAYFRTLGIRTDARGIPDGRSVESLLDRRVAAGSLRPEARAELRQVLIERRRTITNPADLGRRQVAEAIAQTLRWFGVDRQE